MRQVLRELGWMGIVAVLAASAVFAFFALPGLVVSPSDLTHPVTHGPPGRPRATPTPSGVDLVNARNSVRTAAVALIAGLGTALAAGFAARTYYLTRRAQLDERYHAARDQLKSTSEAIRVSAITELEQIAIESRFYHRQVVVALTTFLREEQRPEPRCAASPPPPAVQEAFSAVVLRRRRTTVDLAGADLRQVVLDPRVRWWHRVPGVRPRGARLSGAVLRDAKLSGANLRYSDLRGANLDGIHAPGVRLDHARLNGAVLTGAGLQQATLDGATAKSADFEDAILEDTAMRGTNLRASKGLVLERGQPRGAIVDEKTTPP